MLLGFVGNYRRIMVNQKQELVLLRSASDNDALYFNNTSTNNADTTPGHVQIVANVYWKLPDVKS